MAKSIKIITDIILVIMILILLGYFILKFTGKVQIYKIETGSMEEVIHTGDYVLRYKTNDYKVGDIITYKVDDYFVTHRIVSINGDKLVTKGDANNLEDDEISINQVEGKIIYHGKPLNFVINFKFAIIAFLLVIYLLSYYFEKK